MDTIDEQVDLVAEAVGALNEALDALRGFREDIVGDMRAYAEAKSERWAGSEAGVAYESWIASWEEADLDDVDVPERPGDLEGSEDSYLNGLLDESVAQALVLDLPEAP